MEKTIETAQTYMRPLREEDATPTYAAWLNDPEINQYLETRYATQSVESCKEFIRDCNADPNSHLFGVFAKDTDTHIGNAKLGFIKPRHRTGQFSLFIGDKNYWGKGVSVEVISGVTHFGFETLGLVRVEAGCYEPNRAALHMMLKAGYQEEGRLRSHVELAGERCDVLWLAMLKDDPRP